MSYHMESERDFEHGDACPYCGAGIDEDSNEKIDEGDGVAFMYSIYESTCPACGAKFKAIYKQEEEMLCGTAKFMPGSRPVTYVISEEGKEPRRSSYPDAYMFWGDGPWTVTKGFGEAYDADRRLTLKLCTDRQELPWGRINLGELSEEDAEDLMEKLEAAVAEWKESRE